MSTHAGYPKPPASDAEDAAWLRELATHERGVVALRLRAIADRLSLAAAVDRGA